MGRVRGSSSARPPAAVTTARGVAGEGLRAVPGVVPDDHGRLTVDNVMQVCRQARRSPDDDGAVHPVRTGAERARSPAVPNWSIPTNRSARSPSAPLSPPWPRTMSRSSSSRVRGRGRRHARPGPGRAAPLRPRRGRARRRWPCPWTSQILPTTSARRRPHRAAAAWPASSTSSWERAVGEMPAAGWSPGTRRGSPALRVEPRWPRAWSTSRRGRRRAASPSGPRPGSRTAGRGTGRRRPRRAQGRPPGDRPQPRRVQVGEVDEGGPSSGEAAVRLRWSRMSTGVPGPTPRAARRSRSSGPRRGTRPRGGAHAVDDGPDAASLVEVRPSPEDEGSPAGVTDGHRPHGAGVSGDCGAVEPGTSSLGIVARVCPTRSAVWPQPDPSTKAMSWVADPDRWAMTAAASAASAIGSVAGSSKGLAAGGNVVVTSEA